MLNRRSGTRPDATNDNELGTTRDRLTEAAAMFCAKAMRRLRPLIHIRVDALWALRIGHYVGNVEMYLCRRDEGLEPKSLDLFYHHGPVSNTQVKRMWDRTLHTSEFYRHVFEASVRFPDARDYMVGTGNDQSIFDREGLTVKHGTHLKFTRRELAEGERLVRELTGGKSPSSFVCLQNRDSAYLTQALPQWDFSYHDYRDSHIEDFRPAAEWLASSGHCVFRMGAVVESELDAGGNPCIIDYATSGLRSDFMDVFLEAHCRFHIGDSCGLNEIPRAFRRPVVSTNYIPMGGPALHALAPGALIIPKKVWLREGERFLTFAEIVAASRTPGLDWGQGQTYQALGVVPVENTPEEILQVAQEMEARIDGTWVETPEDRELQKRFWYMLQSDAGEKLGARIGAAFLRENRGMLA